VSPTAILSPSCTVMVAPYGTASRLRTAPSAVRMMISPSRLVTMRVPSGVVTVVMRSNCATPSTLLFRTVVAAMRAAVPPMWKVRSVSCVPGSPIDCAARIPTASPGSTIPMVARFRP
jgi:hypothetical protein